MFMNLLKICQKTTFQFNLSELLLCLTGVLSILMTIALTKKLKHMLQKNKLIDERMRERRSRIARTAAEIDYSAVHQPNTIYDRQEDNLTSRIDESTFEKSADLPKKVKTRAMSMEERWADFEKKRATKNPA